MKTLCALLLIFLVSPVQAGDNLRLELYEFLYRTKINDYVFRNSEMKRVTVSCGRQPLWGVFLKAMPIDRPDSERGTGTSNWVAYNENCDSMMLELVRVAIDRPGQILIRFERDEDSYLQSYNVIELSFAEQQEMIEKKKTEQLGQISRR